MKWRGCCFFSECCGKTSDLINSVDDEDGEDHYVIPSKQSESSFIKELIICLFSPFARCVDNLAERKKEQRWMAKKNYNS